MTKAEFQQRYQHYRTQSKQEAEAEMDKANAEGITDDIAVIMRFPGLGWGLMLGSAAGAILALYPDLLKEQ